MKKDTIILVIILVAIAIFLFYLKNSSLLKSSQTEELINVSSFIDIADVSDQDIIEFLKLNQDAKDYLEKNTDFRIEEKLALTKNSITEGQNGENFKEVYSDLELEDNRYLKIVLMNSDNNNGLISVLDLKDKKVLKAYGLILLKAQPN